MTDLVKQSPYQQNVARITDNKRKYLSQNETVVRCSFTKDPNCSSIPFGGRY